MRLFSIAAVIAFILDQLSKYFVRINLSYGESAPAIDGLFHFEHVHNYGAAWGVFSGQQIPLILFTVFVTGFILFSAREITSHGKLPSIGFGMILGGALGNLVDRIWQGYVTDFIDLDTPFRIIETFPVFNIADSALTVGVVLMLLSLILNKRK
jgi:signal peptidase II